ncbi:MAG: tetratricopeptide repeat protein [Candidatus Eisenbacteria bacterium]|uniref:Tetratricopeptide repeat protein n=1 Tax=Eiseniibacteriota bacterium TaxID=2212470 RepID=A0A7Y2H2M6_UNCEI|nr:tetratricopeptide repeat protein [Candidatus Eisenbacteria bacterium]
MTIDPTLLIAILALGLVFLLWGIWGWMRMRSGEQASPATAYTRGLSALISGRRKEALDCLKEAVQHDSENLDAYIRLGDLLRDGGEPNKALAVHKDLTVRSRLTPAERVRIMTSVTKDYLAASRFEEAGSSAERLKQLDKNNPFAYQALRHVAESLEDWPRAVQAMQDEARVTGRSDKKQHASYLCRVGGRVHATNADEAMSLYLEALKLDPNAVEAHLALGDIHLERGETKKAIEHWRSFALGAPERAFEVFERLERSYFELGQFGEVVTFYRELLHRSPREASAPALLALAEIHRRKGDFDEAENFVRDALDIDPGDFKAHRHWIKLALDREDPAEALSRLDRMLDATQDGKSKSLPVLEETALLQVPQDSSPENG